MRSTTDRDAARELRRTQTDAERKLWNVLRDRQLLNLKFRRQHPIGNYIADFCCIEKGLIIELDGSQHVERAAYDEERTKWLNSQGFQVLRFPNDEVLRATEGVIEKIKTHIFKRTLTRPDDGPTSPTRERN
jgi:adenine-specific DNA-methyltransferase